MPGQTPGGKVLPDNKRGDAVEPDRIKAKGVHYTPPELAEFLAYLRGGTAPISDLAEGIEVVERISKIADMVDA